MPHRLRQAANMPTEPMRDLPVKPASLIVLVLVCFTIQ